MIDPHCLLARALRAAHLAGDEVGRVELDRQDGVLLERREDRQWLRYVRDQVIPVDSANDERVPLARQLSGADHVVAYRPGRRIVVSPPSRSEALESGSAQPVFYQKGYRRGRSFKARERHSEGYRAAQGTGFQVAEVQSWDPDLDALVFEALSGTRPDSLIAHAESLFRVGDALRQLQSFRGSLGLEEFDATCELDVLGRWEARSLVLLGNVPDGWDDCREALELASRRLPSPQLVPAHRDLHDGQLLIARRTIGLLDMDLYCLADNVLDAANLMAHLVLRALQRGENSEEVGVRETSEALIEGLSRRSEPGFWERLRFYQATSFLRLALVYAVRPRWNHLAPSLTELGVHCAAEAIR